MALQDYNNGADDTGQLFASGEPAAQTFTASASYELSSIKLKLGNFGTTPGTIHIDLYAVSGGIPTGSSLSSGTVNGDTLEMMGGWVDIPMTAFSVVATTVYAIVASAPDSAGSFALWAHQSSGAYANGERLMWQTGGWSSMTGEDHVFEVYGSAGAVSVEISGTIGIVIGLTGSATRIRIVELAGVSEIVFAIAGRAHKPFKTDVTAPIRYIVAAGNNQIWYEGI
jgi:hypothetical protein